jgi:iron complex outermembrane receptor protein
MKCKHLPVLVSVVLCQMSWAQTSSSKDVKSGRLEEVIVSARRVSENLQEVPVAVTALNSEALSKANITNLGSLSQLVAGLDSTEGRKEAGFFIRGVGKKAVGNPSEESGVGVYLDGVYLPRNDSQLMDLLDIETVQVLRGPQGTLFGKNAIGGALLVTSKKPTEQFEGDLEAGLGPDGRRNLRVALNIPLVENKLYGRFSASQVNYDGYYRDSDTGDLIGSESHIGLAASLRWYVSDVLTMDTFHFYSEQDDGAPAAWCRPVNAGAVAAGTRAPRIEGTYIEHCASSEARLYSGTTETENNGQFYKTDGAYLGGVVLTRNYENFEIKSLTSWSYGEAPLGTFNNDGTGILGLGNSPAQLKVLADNGINEDKGLRVTYAQDLQIAGDAFDGRMKYTTGLYWGRDLSKNGAGGNSLTETGWAGFNESPVGAADLLVILGGPFVPALNNAEGVDTIPDGTVAVIGNYVQFVGTSENTTQAVYGQATWDFTDSIHLTGGLRYSFEKRYGGSEGYFADAPPFQIMTEAQFNALGSVPLRKTPFEESSATFERVSPSVSLAMDVHQLIEMDTINSMLMYLNVSEGFKSGGFSTGNETFDPEVLVSTEFGIKMDAFDSSLRLNLAIFDASYRDIQLLVAEDVGGGNTIVVTRNAGEASTRGAEVELTWWATPKLQIGLNANYINAKFIEYEDELVNPATNLSSGTIDRSGEDFFHVPDSGGSLNVSYFQTLDVGELTYSLTAVYRGEMYVGFDTESAKSEYDDYSRIDAYTTFHGRLTFSANSRYGDYNVALFASNLLDEEYITTGQTLAGSLGTSVVIPGAPRTVGLQLGLKF